MIPYEPIEIEVIAFDTEDLIITSNSDSNTPWASND